MSEATLAVLRARLAAGRTTSRALVAEALERIADPAGQGARAFIRVFREQALAAAAASDALRAAGVPARPLEGLPISVKDLCNVQGSVTTAGSRALRGRPPAAHDAPVVARLRAAGAVIVGTTNMTEFAMGGPGINPHYGTPLNPWDRATGRLPGGSSSGAAVSVADGMAAAALGTDTAGSVQMPAAFCGLAGIKPTASRVPMEGTIPLAPSQDSIGSLGRSVECCAIMDAVMAGIPEEPLSPPPARLLRFIVPQSLVLDDLEPPVAAAFQRALSILSAAGARIVELPFAELAELAAAQAKGSYSVMEGYAWHRELLSTAGDQYDPIVAGRFRRGAAIPAADYIALGQARRRLIAEAARITAGFDAVLMPTVPLVPPPLADFRDNEPLWLSTNLRMVRNPGVANFLDRCAVSIPCHRAGEPPVGLSLMGEHLGDRRLLAVAQSAEAALAGAR